MPVKETTSGDGTLYFAHSGEKIGVVKEISLSGPIDLGGKFSVDSAGVLNASGATITFSLNNVIFGGRKAYNKTWRKWLEYSYTEFRFPKKRWRSRKRRMKRFLKRIRLYAKGEPASEEEWHIHLKEIGYENDANTRIDCDN